jgi:HEAT repeat protein
VFREGPVELLTAALAAPDWRTRRAAHLTALAVGRLDLAQMLHAAEHDGDLLTRIRCAEAAVKTAAAAGTVDLVRPLLSSGTAMVRAEAVHTLARGGDITPAIAALADRNPIVRAVAQAALRRTGSEPVEQYRRLVMTSLPEPGAIAGLGETGTADDASLIPSWLDHPQPRGRAEAVRALRRLGAADPDTLSAMLTDPSGAVTRQVTITLRPWASRLDLPRLRELLTESNPQHVRMAAYRLLHERDTWTRLLIDLELAADPFPSMRNRARSDIATWLTREAATTYSMPQGRTADALTQQLCDAEDVLGPDRVRLLRFHLGLKPPSNA